MTARQSKPSRFNAETRTKRCPIHALGALHIYVFAGRKLLQTRYYAMERVSMYLPLSQIQECVLCSLSNPWAIAPAVQQI